MWELKEAMHRKHLVPGKHSVYVTNNNNISHKQVIFYVCMYFMYVFCVIMQCCKLEDDLSKKETPQQTT